MTVGVLTGLSMAGNLMTMYMFYEFMTLITVPLVIHSQGRDALKAGLKYLGYSVFGAGLTLIGFFFPQFLRYQYHVYRRRRTGYGKK